jgi:hypothetical protein
MAAQEGSDRTYTIELTASDLRVARAALRSFMNDFGHDERDVYDMARAVMRKLPDVDAMELSAS